MNDRVEWTPEWVLFGTLFCIYGPLKGTVRDRRSLRKKSRKPKKEFQIDGLPGDTVEKTHGREPSPSSFSPLYSSSGNIPRKEVQTEAEVRTTMGGGVGVGVTRVNRKCKTCLKNQSLSPKLPEYGKTDMTLGFDVMRILEV